jgi:hypothetical protein
VNGTFAAELKSRRALAGAVNMMPNALSWSNSIRQKFIPSIENFSDFVKNRILPSFASINEEVDNLAEATLNSYEQAVMVAYTEELAGALDEVEEFHETMTGMAQGMRNLFGIGLYHLFEQQFLRFHRSELLESNEVDNTSLFETDVGFKRLKHHEIHVDRFRSWEKVKELKTLANALKHADGPACEQLKKRRPDLFSRPESLVRIDLKFQKVFEPLAGQNIYLTEEAFDEFVAGVKEFWNELAERLEKN